MQCMPPLQKPRPQRISLMLESTDDSLKILEVFQSDFQNGVSERANDYPPLYLYRTCAPAYMLLP
jgi:hypothetical protein